MKEAYRLPILLIFSFFFHYGIIFLIPSYTLPPLIKEDVYEVKLIKPKPIVQTADNGKNLKSNNSEDDSKIKKVAPAQKKIIDYAGMKRPDMVLPSMTTEETVHIPDVSLNNSDLTTGQHAPDLTNVNKELKSASKSFNQYNEDAGKKGLDTAEYGDSSFYSFKKVDGNARNPVIVPATPMFSLENNTKVVLRFKVDRYGNPSNIVYITSSDSRIEKIAFDFVSGIKFEAVNYESPDSVEITLYFKVN